MCLHKHMIHNLFDAGRKESINKNLFAEDTEELTRGGKLHTHTHTQSHTHVFFFLPRERTEFSASVAFVGARVP